MKLRIGTRGSDLALWQARHIASRLAPEAECELVILKTRGDIIDHVSLVEVEGKAFFTAELEEALVENEVDLAVHSHKDLPSEMRPELVIAAVPERAAQHERLLVRPNSYDPSGAFLPLSRGACIGTSSPRRAEQIRALRPDLKIEALRGNVPTRVKKLRDERYDAIVLASAGLDRLALDLSNLVDVALPLEWFVPAPAQGALAVQTRSSDRELIAFLAKKLHREEVRLAIAAERELLVRAGGGCNLPIGAAISGRAPFTAHVFLGPDHPTKGATARWAQATGSTPIAAAEAAYSKIIGIDPTHAGPLAGRTIALCGSTSGPSEFGERLELLGARVVYERAIEFEELETPELASKVESARAIVVTSRHAALRLSKLRAPARAFVAAVGRATAHELERAGWHVDLVGDSGGAELAKRLPLERGAEILFPCAEETLGEFEHAAEERGLAVDRVALYRTKAAKSLALSAADARVYFSPSAARAVRPLEVAKEPGSRFALGASTARELESFGARVDGTFQASHDGPNALVQLLARSFLTLEVTR